MAEDWETGGFGLYVHWPFCEAKCPYCDFNSHVAGVVDQDRWRRAFLREITRVGAETPGRRLDSIFFGGGTPSLMAPATVAAIIDAACDAWAPAPDIEITLEANPGSVEAGRFRDYRAAGVNRLSMGIQALNDADLKRLGRIHSVDEAMRALGIARSTFDRFSFDLIYGRQDQTLGDWEAELRRALEMASDHLSLYQLTIEPGTVFGTKHAAGRLPGLPDEDRSADMFDLTREICIAAGLPAYEVSNHARPGSESRHNLIYWSAGDYAGIGPGAHGRLTLGGTRFATEARRSPGGWLDDAERGVGESVRVPVSPEDQGREYLVMGLRLAEGIDVDRLKRMNGVWLDGAAVNELEELGLVARSGNRLYVTDQGVSLTNTVISRLIPG